MKYIIPYIAMIILFGTACDNYEISSTQSEAFVKYYGVGLEDEGIQVITTGQGYLIMANVEIPGRGKDICIITTDEYGNTTSPVTTIGGRFDDIGYRIKPREGGYIIAGSQALQNGEKDVYVIQIAANGTVQWRDSIPWPNNNEAYDVLEEEDGDLVFTGYTETGETSKQRDLLFLKWSTSGDSIKNFTSRGLPGTDEEAYSFVLWRDSTYMFAGYQVNSGVKDIYLLRWGGFSSIPIPKTIISETNTEARSIIHSNTPGKFLVACNSESSITQSEILLLETDASMSNQNIVSIPLGERPVNKVHSMVMNNETLYLCGTSSSGDLGYGDMLLIKLTGIGSAPQYYYIGDGSSYTGMGFDITNENGYVITGASYLNEKSMITLYKVNSEGSF